jgi:hypothetical protein
VREHHPGDAEYRDFSDPRPWATVYTRNDKAIAERGKWTATDHHEVAAVGT